MLGIGILGASTIAHDFAQALLVSHQPAKIVALGCTDADRGETFATKFNIDTVYPNYDDLLKDERVHLVYITVVNAFHCEWSVKAMQAKKHVLCEKPLALDIVEVHQMIAAAKLNRVFLMEALWSRCMPSYAFIKQQIAADAIGTVKYIAASFYVPLGTVPSIVNAPFGGGTMNAIGIYLIQFALHILRATADVQSVKASGTLFPTGVDQSANISIQFRNSAFVVLRTHSMVNGDTAAIVYGTKGQIEVKEFWAPSSVTVNGVATHFEVDPTLKDTFKLPNSQHLQHEISHVIHCIRENLLESPLMSHSESLIISEVMTSVCNQLGVPMSRTRS